MWSPNFNSVDWQNMVERTREYLSRAQTENILILAGADPDGFVSAHFVRLALKRFRNKSTITASYFSTFQYTFADVIELHRRHAPCDTVCLDIPIIQEPDVLRSISKSSNVLVCDHHVPPDSLPTIPNVLYLNPRLGRTPNIRLPTCLMAYEAARQMSVLIEADSISLAAGLMGDGALHQFSDLVNSLSDDLCITDSNRDLSHSLVGLLSRGILAWFQSNPTSAPPFSLDELRVPRSNCRHALESFLEQTKLRDAIMKVDATVEAEARRIAGRTVDDSVLLTHELVTDYFVSNLVANRLVRDNPKKVAAVFYSYNDLVQSEIRVGRELNVDLTQVFRLQRENFRPLSAGGHPTAGGAIIRRQDRSEFVTTLIEAIVEALKR